MDGQSQVCNLNGAETFKSQKKLEINTVSIDSQNMLSYALKSDLTLKFQNTINDSSEERDTFTINGPTNPKVVPCNEIFGPKKTFSNRLSCVMDYNTTESKGSLKRNKLSGRLGLGVSNTNGQQQKERKKCFLCDKEGTTQVGWDNTCRMKVG